jgi:hypothetical protein
VKYIAYKISENLYHMYVATGGFLALVAKNLTKDEALGYESNVTLVERFN